MINLLTKMGAKIRRKGYRTIVISGVKKLEGTDYEIMPDRNEVVTFAIGALATGGDVTIDGTQREYLGSFLEELDETKACWEPLGDRKTRFYTDGILASTKIKTSPYPGFMTDWQSPWALLMTQAVGKSTIHETVYEERFGYVDELKKIGAKIDYFNPEVSNPKHFYNFNWSDRKKEDFHAINITGPTILHNGVMEVMDLRAGATLVLGALVAKGESVVFGVEHIDRGYERIEERLRTLGARIKREEEK